MVRPTDHALAAKLLLPAIGNRGQGSGAQQASQPSACMPGLDQLRCYATLVPSVLLLSQQTSMPNAGGLRRRTWPPPPPPPPPQRRRRPADPGLLFRWPAAPANTRPSVGPVSSLAPCSCCGWRHALDTPAAPLPPNNNLPTASARYQQLRPRYTVPPPPTLRQAAMASASAFIDASTPSRRGPSMSRTSISKTASRGTGEWDNREAHSMLNRS